MIVTIGRRPDSCDFVQSVLPDSCRFLVDRVTRKDRLQAEEEWDRGQDAVGLEICGYVHDGEEPPPSCIICGAPSSRFVEWTDNNGGGSNDKSGGTSPDESKY